MISDYDREHMEDIIAGHGDWFTAKLLRLCAKADLANLERIRRGFPEVVEAFEHWRYRYQGAGARRTTFVEDADAYELDDPKHPSYHDRMSAIYDDREK